VTPTNEVWFTWKEPRQVDGRVRLLTPWSDPAEHETPFDLLFETAEEAKAAREEHGAQDEPWVLVRLTLEELDEGDQPITPTAATPALDVDQVLEIAGFGRYALTAEATLVQAPAEASVHARAETGSVIYLRGLHHADGVHPLLGPGYFVIEQDYSDLEDDTTPFPALTALVQND
jgi:hypothetical protein